MGKRMGSKSLLAQEEGERCQEGPGAAWRSTASNALSIGLHQLDAHHTSPLRRKVIPPRVLEFYQAAQGSPLKGGFSLAGAAQQGTQPHPAPE